jgi:hypothetical protein
MEHMANKPITQIEGISAGEELGAALKFGADLASSLHQLLPDSANPALHRATLMSAIQTLNLMIAASNAQCTRAAPPADIDITLNEQGDLIYRCQHKQPHKWDMQGHRI